VVLGGLVGGRVVVVAALRSAASRAGEPSGANVVGGLVVELTTGPSPVAVRAVFGAVVGGDGAARSAAPRSGEPSGALEPLEASASLARSVRAAKANPPADSTNATARKIWGARGRITTTHRATTAAGSRPKAFSATAPTHVESRD